MSVAFPVVIHAEVAAVGEVQGACGPMETVVPTVAFVAVGGSAVAAHIHAATAVQGTQSTDIPAVDAADEGPAGVGSVEVGTPRDGVGYRPGRYEGFNLNVIKQ